MSTELERILSELERVTARMLGTTCWEQSGEFGELLASRSALAARLTDRRDLDAGAALRIRAAIHAGNGLIAPLMAMRQSVLDSLAEADAQRRFTRGLVDALPSQAENHRLDLKA